MSREPKDRIEAQGRLIMARNLGAQVHKHDLNSGSSIFDARVEYPDGRLAAAEFSAIEDQQLLQRNAQLDRIGPEIDCTHLRFSWRLHFRNDAKVRSSPKARKTLCRVLGEMEQQVTGSPQFRTIPLSMEARDLGISLVELIPDGPAGRVYLFQGWGSNEFAASDVPGWITSLFLDDAQQDNVRKLQNSGLEENHMYWRAGDGVPTPITSLLEDPEKNLPRQAPIVPDSVTDVWLVSGLSSQGGWRWNQRDGWIALNFTARHLNRGDG